MQSPLLAQVAPNQCEVSIDGELGHVSTIIYAIPSARIERNLPENFIPDNLCVDGRATSLISVSSFLDLGSGLWGREPFEQTIYRLHVRHSGKPANILLGFSVGSLSAIATRHLWQMPWHLGAMEFQINYSKDEGRYLHYRLRTQSQWANAYWEISDSGQSIKNEMDGFVLSLVNRTVFTDYYQRRDGSIGSRRMQVSIDHLTSGALVNARCDLLERIGLVSIDEMMRPVLVTLLRRLACNFDTPQSDSSPSRIIVTTRMTQNNGPRLDH